MTPTPDPHARRRLAESLPSDGPLSPADADAWLEAHHAEPLPANWADRVAPDDAAWVELLAAEAELTRDGTTPALEARLTALAAAPAGAWVSDRAAAALVRAGIPGGRADLQLLDGRALPAWERDYLRGLAAWARGDDGTAALEAALAVAPHETCVRLALAVALPADAALDVLMHPAPTRELLVTRAALLARLGRFAEAEEAITALDGSRGREAARHSWAAARAAYHVQEQLLRTALAERRVAWPAAARAWAASGVPARQPDLGRARAAFAAGRELEALPAGAEFRRDGLRRRVEHELRALGDGPLAGDARFFRAAARGGADLEALLRQPEWVAAERAAGGGRLVVVGDLLLRSGRTADAAAAYDAAGDAARLAVARAAVPAALRAGAAGELPADAPVAARVAAAGRADDVAAFIRAAGPDWPAACPVDPEWAARTLLVAWCAADRRAEAQAFVDGLVRRGVAWAEPLAILVRVGGALEAALAGHLDAAVRALDT